LLGSQLFTMISLYNIRLMRYSLRPKLSEFFDHFTFIKKNI